MSANVEVKARVRNLTEVAKSAWRLAGEAPGQTIEQVDTFFKCTDGRLKLRVFQRNDEHPDAVAELIWYARDDTTDSKLSTFRKLDIANPAALGALLEQALGIVGVVKKTRVLFVHEATHTRIHIDRVERLGDFVELEVQLQPGQTLAEAHDIAGQHCRTLGIEYEDRVAGAYVDVIRAKAEAAEFAERLTTCYVTCTGARTAPSVFDITGVGRVSALEDPAQFDALMHLMVDALRPPATEGDSGQSGGRAAPAPQAPTCAVLVEPMASLSLEASQSRAALFEDVASWPAEDELKAKADNPWD